MSAGLSLLQDLLVSIVSVDSLVHFTSADAERVPTHPRVALVILLSLSKSTPRTFALVEAENFPNRQVRVLKDKIHEAKSRFREVLRLRCGMIKSLRYWLSLLCLACPAGVKTETMKDLSKLLGEIREPALCYEQAKKKQTSALHRCRLSGRSVPGSWQSSRWARIRW